MVTKQNKYAEIFIYVCVTAIVTFKLIYIITFAQDRPSRDRKRDDMDGCHDTIFWLNKTLGVEC